MSSIAGCTGGTAVGCVVVEGGVVEEGPAGVAGVVVVVGGAAVVQGDVEATNEEGAMVPTTGVVTVVYIVSDPDCVWGQTGCKNTDDFGTVGDLPCGANGSCVVFDFDVVLG